MAELFDELRPKAFAVAYRMLGGVGDAEFIVQEGLLFTGCDEHSAGTL